MIKTAGIINALNNEELERAERLARHTEFLELAALPEFQDEFVDQGAFESTTLKDGDVVEFIYFMGGGK